jgi:hypothetical protein
VWRSKQKIPFGNDSKKGKDKSRGWFVFRMNIPPLATKTTAWRRLGTHESGFAWGMMERKAKADHPLCEG